MKPKERVMTAFNHKEPDRVPLFYRDVPNLRKRLLEELKISDFDTLLKELGVDFRWIGAQVKQPEVSVENPLVRNDIWGIQHDYREINEITGYWHISTNPLKGATLAEIENFNWPTNDLFDFSSIKKDCNKYKDYALMTKPGHNSPSILQFPYQGLVSDEESFMLPYLNPDIFYAIQKKILLFQKEFISRVFKESDNSIDFFRMGDDFGTQEGLMISPDMYNQFFKPALSELARVATQRGAHYYHHSCGAVLDLIPSLIETGIEVLDPIQVSSKGMVPSILKKEFGDQLVFSGGIDEGELLSHGTPKEIREAVFRLFDDMGKEGGLFIGPTHNLQEYIPTDNIMALYQAAKECRY